MITQKLLAHIDTLKPKVDEWAVEAVINNAQIIISILQENQLDKGLDSTGSVVGYYQRVTETFYATDPQNRPRKPKETGQPYNFDWTGEFFETMTIRAKSNESEYDIFSTTGKDAFLSRIYGTDLTKFTKENNDFVNKNIIETYIAKKIEENLFSF